MVGDGNILLLPLCIRHRYDLTMSAPFKGTNQASVVSGYFFVCLFKSKLL